MLDPGSDPDGERRRDPEIDPAGAWPLPDLDLADLEALLQVARQGDIDAGDELGEAAVEAAMSGAGRVLSQPELAAMLAEHTRPGPGLGYWVDQVQAAKADDFGLVGAAAACRRLVSWAQSRELGLVAEIAARAAARNQHIPVGPDGRPGQVPAEAASEIALALRMSQFGATCWTDLAVTLTWRLCRTAAALQDGVIDLTKARLMAELTSVLDDAGARSVEEKVLPTAGSKTPGQLRAALRRAVISVDPEAAERRRQQAERKARIGLFPDEEGTATLSGQNLPGIQAAAAMARICALAQAMKASGAGGGIDLLRAQVFIGLLLGTLPLIPPADDAPPEPPGPADDNPGPWGNPPADPPDPADQSDPSRSSDPPDPSDSPDPPEPAGPPDPSDSAESPNPPGDLPDDTSSGASPSPGLPADKSSEASSPGSGPPPGAPPDELWHEPDHGRSLGIPAWPGLPLPADTPSELTRSLSGAISGLPPDSSAVGLLTLLVPWRALAGISAEPGQLGRLGPITREAARELAEIAALDPRVLWRVIVTDEDGRAIAVTRIRRSRARSPGRGGARADRAQATGAQADRARAGCFPRGEASHRGQGLVGQVTLIVRRDLIHLPDTIRRQRPDTTRPREPSHSRIFLGPPGTPDGDLEAVLTVALGVAADVLACADTEAEAARSSQEPCSHQRSSPAYRPPARLREFVAARDQTCRFPPCRQSAQRADLDHTKPYHQGGPTCDCNLGGDCRTHHQVKQRPGWSLQQPSPGIFEWRTPSGRQYRIEPDPYPT